VHDRSVIIGDSIHEHILAELIFLMDRTGSGKEGVDKMCSGKCHRAAAVGQLEQKGEEKVSLNCGGPNTSRVNSGG
jgi:hypothetical protein